MKRSAVLVTPGAIDGYPPVQYQARLLADAGYSVEVVTVPLRPGLAAFEFEYPGVRISGLSDAQTFGGRRVARLLAMARNLLGARLRAGRNAVEIAYDPLGLLYSDIVPMRPRRRIAHLHERIHRIDGYLEKRLIKAICGYDEVVVPDPNRALDIAEHLPLSKPCVVVQNYPLRAEVPFAKPQTGRFEVVYAGSLGHHQKLDLVIRSVASWPQDAHLVLLGDETRKPAQDLAALAGELGVAERVHFLGWMKTHDAEQRLAHSDLAISLQAGIVEKGRAVLGASNKRFQYMKAGLAQIGDMSPGIADMLEGNGIGASITEDDPLQLAGLVRAYMDDPARCQDEGQKAFSLHQDTYNYEKVFQPLLDKIVAW